MGSEIRDPDSLPAGDGVQSPGVQSPYDYKTRQGVDGGFRLHPEYAGAIDLHNQSGNAYLIEATPFVAEKTRPAD